MSAKPLDGIKVVELSTFVAAPCAARLLADLGAEVIKIESFTGDPWRGTGMNMINRGPEENPIFDIYNIGKESICVNIKNPKGLDLLFRMLEKADIFITNTRAKSLKKLGLDAPTLQQRFPGLVIGSIDGFGPAGPDADSPGFDNVAFWNRSGSLWDLAVETDDYYPMFAPTGSGDSITGNALVTGILAALYKREKTGRGDVVNVSLYSTAIWSMGSMVIRAQEKYGDKYPKKRGDMNPLTTQYKCSDGKWFCITVLEYPRYAPKVYELLGITEAVSALGVTDYRSMKQNSAKLIELMEASFRTKTLEEWQTLFREADIVSGAMSHFKDVTEDEQAWVNEFVEEYAFRSGETCVMPCTPVKMASYRKERSMPAPGIGENTDEVLRRMGYSGQEIEEMHACGAVQ